MLQVCDVAVVIPCYGQAHMLPVAIRSCLDQDLPPAQIVVVDDGSPDDVAGACSPFGDRIQVIHQENRGLAQARNHGLAEVKCASVIFLDSDDWLLSGCLNQMSRIAGPDRLIICGSRNTWEDHSHPDEDFYPQFGNLSESLARYNIGPVHSILHPVQVLKNLGGFHPKIGIGGHEDYQLLCQYALSGITVVCVQEILVVYLQRHFSMVRQTEPMHRSRIDVFSWYVDQWLKRGVGPSLVTAMIEGLVETFFAVDGNTELLPVADRLFAALSPAPFSILSRQVFAAANLMIWMRSQSDDLRNHLIAPVYKIMDQAIQGIMGWPMSISERFWMMSVLERLAQEDPLRAAQYARKLDLPWVRDLFFAQGPQLDKHIDFFSDLTARIRADGFRKATIFGAGMVGRCAAIALMSAGVAITAFVDSAVEMQGKTLWGIPIESLENAHQRKESIFVIGSLSNSTIMTQIVREMYSPSDGPTIYRLDSESTLQTQL